MTGFRLFLLARAISWAGSAVTLVALPVLLFQRTGSPALTGLLTTLEAVPYLVLGLPAGALVDRWDQRRTLVGTSWFSAAVMLSVPVASVAGWLTTGQLLIAALLTSSAFVFFDAAGFGVVPVLVGRDCISAATSRMMTISTIIGLLGPAAGGALSTVLGPPHALTIDAASYAVAAGLLTRLHWTAQPDASRDRSTGRDIAQGLRYIWNQPIIRSLTLLGTGNSLTAGAVTGLIIVAAVRRLGLSDHDARLGLLFAAASVGSLAAGLAIARLQKRVRVGAITLAGLAGNLAFLLAFAQTTAFPPALLVIALWQATNTLVSLNGIVVRQALTPAELQGRVNTTARMIAWGGQPVGAGLGGLLAAHLGVRIALLLAAVGVAASVIAGLATSLRGSPALAALLSETQSS